MDAGQYVTLTRDGKSEQVKVVLRKGNKAEVARGTGERLRLKHDSSTGMWVAEDGATYMLSR